MTSPRTLLGRLGHAAFGVWSTLAFVAVALPVVGIAALLPGVARRRRLVRGGAAACFALTATRVTVVGLHHLPPSGCIVVANHASYLDGVVLTAALPPRFSFVIKREVTRVPLVHFLLRRIGSEFVTRFDAERGAVDARRIVRQARARACLAFFPEGTFRREPGLNRFHPGAFVAAVRGDLPVVPVVIRGSRSMLPAEQLLPRPGRIEVIIRPPLAVPPGQPVRQLLTAARQSILEELGEPDLT
jgi:1-acyl-sn-glycerol-3-phosphate acyltransferase